MFLAEDYTPRPRRSSSKSLFSLFKRQSQPRLGALAAGATPLRGDDAASTYADAGPTKSHVYQTPNAISPLSSIHSGHSQPPPPHWNKSSSELLLNSQSGSQPQWQQQDSIQPHPLQSSQQQQQQQHDADLLALDFPLSRSPASGSVLSMESQKELQMRKRHSRSLSLSVVEDDEPLVSPLSPSDSIVSSSSFSSNNAGKDDRLHVNPILRKSSSNTSLRSSQTSSPVSILKKRSSSSSLASGFTSPLSAASSSSRSRPPTAASSSSRMIPHANQHHHHQPSLEPKKKMNRPVAKSSSYLNLRDQYHQALPVPSMQPRSRSVSPIPMAQMAQMAPMASNYAQNRQRPRKNANAPPPPLSAAMPPLSRSPSPLLSPMAYDDAPPHPRLGRPRSSSSLSSQYAAGASSSAAWLGVSGQKRRQPGTRTPSLYRARSHEQLGWNDMASAPPQPRPRRSWTGKIDVYASHGERAMYQPPPPTQPANRRRSASRLSWYGRTDDHSRTPPAAVYSSQEPALDDLCAFFHHLPRHVLAKYLHNAHGDFYLAKDMCMEDIMIHGI
ncbi:hypothetical protein BC940DRAFT_98562 [Gongronella butleri]|nr:hypothetical protein BC940DRAFT_98562 [Gongronella butleri]